MTELPHPDPDLLRTDAEKDRWFSENEPQILERMIARRRYARAYLALRTNLDAFRDQELVKEVFTSIELLRLRGFTWQEIGAIQLSESRLLETGAAAGSITTIPGSVPRV